MLGTISTTTEYVSCGPGGELELHVGFDPPSVTLLTDTGNVDLSGRRWVYGFLDPGDPLILRFRCAETTTVMEGELVVGDTATASPTPLASDGTTLRLEITRPEGDAGSQHELRFRLDAGTSGFAATALGDSDRDVNDPESAQPTLVITPKKRCPTGVPKTGDDEAPPSEPKPKPKTKTKTKTKKPKPKPKPGP